MENKDWDAIQGNADCPYINGTLLPIASRAERYFAPNDLHPSEPNYLWLERELPLILASDAYTNNGAVFIVWDEGHKKMSPIGMVLLSPLAKGHGYANLIEYTHSSLLRTVQGIFGVEPLLGDAANAASLSDLFVP